MQKPEPCRPTIYEDNHLWLLVPTVSVVVPNYNHARFLRRRVDTILAQTFKDFELILLDDCSTDDSRLILSSYAGDLWVQSNSINRIPAALSNNGIRVSGWLAGNMFGSPNPMTTPMSTCSRNWCRDSKRSQALCSAIAGRGRCRRRAPSGFLDSYLADIDPRKWTADFRADGEEECRKYLVRRNTVLSASSIVFRKDVYDQVGGADETLILCGDWKTWAAMALTGGAIAYVGEPLNYYRFHDTSVTTRSQKRGVGPVEALLVIDWILERVKLEKEARENLCAEIYNLWGSAVLNNRIPIRARWSILKGARAVDRHALRRLIRPALTALRLTVARRWRSLWGGLVEGTYGAGR